MMECFQLGPFEEVPRLWVGLWQLSSNAWGTAPVSRIRSEMKRHVEEGYTAFGTFIMEEIEQTFVLFFSDLIFFGFCFYSRHGKLVASLGV